MKGATKMTSKQPVTCDRCSDMPGRPEPDLAVVRITITTLDGEVLESEKLCSTCGDFDDGMLVSDATRKAAARVGIELPPARR